MNKKIFTSIFILIVILTVAFLINKSYPLEVLTWNTYSSKKVPLSFSYPHNFPVKECEEYLDEPLHFVEFIRFSSSCDIRSNDVSGGITVTMSKGSDDLEKSGFFGNKLEYNSVLIGSVQGFQLITTKQTTAKGQSLSESKNTQLQKYYVFSKNLKYEIVINDANPIIHGKINSFLASFHF